MSKALKMIEKELAKKGDLNRNGLSYREWLKQTGANDEVVSHFFMIPVSRFRDAWKAGKNPRDFPAPPSLR